jgi:hypothetical protein
MRIQIEHDDSGEIKSVAGPVSVRFSDDSEGTCGRTPSEGHWIVEVEAEEVQHELDFDGFRKVIATYRVAGHPHQPLLVPR